MDERLRPISESSRRSPSSPGKRRMVDATKGKVRLISRGLPDSDEEDQQPVIISQPQEGSSSSIGAREPRVLNLSASRKRKTIEPSTGEQTVLVLPSPTTQIARQIDSIRLAGTPVYGGYSTRLLPMLGGSDSVSSGSGGGGTTTPSSAGGEMTRMLGDPVIRSVSLSPSPTLMIDQTATVIDSSVHTSTSSSSSRGVISPTSPNCVPSVGTNVEITEEEEESSAMERVLQRPRHALNMKRAMEDEEDNARTSQELYNEEDDSDVGTSRGRKDKMTKYSHVSNRSNSQTPPIRVPTIVGMSSPSSSAVTSFSPPMDKLSQQPTSSGPPSLSTGYLIVPFPLPPTMQSPSGASSLSVSSVTHTPIPSNLSSTTMSSSSSSSSSSSNSSNPNQPTQSKVSNFSISELLSKNDNRSRPPKLPVAQSTTFPAIPPSFLTLYYQQWYMQMLSNMKRFQGEAAEVDSGPVTRTGTSSTTPPLLVASDRDKPSGSSSVGSPSTTNEMPSPASLISHSSSSQNVSSPVNPTNNNESGDNNQGESTEAARNVTRSLLLPNGGSSLDSRASESSSSNTGGGEGESIPDQRQNALLQVSEAHLAILPDEDGDTPLHLSIIQENIPLTFYLVRLISGVRMNLDIANNLRQTPLHLSIITRQPMLTHLLVQNGASVNFPDRRGNTCVHLAAQRKNVDVLQILSQSTNPIPDFNCRNFAGLTPVHLATKEGSVDVLKFLFQVGANKNCADSCSGRTPLHYAVESQNFQMCNFLLENGCNVNAVTFSGNTPLHVAAGRRLKEIVAVLMAYGANPAIANGEGDFPSDLPASLLMQRAKMNTR